MDPARRTVCSEWSVEPGRVGVRCLGHAVQVGSRSVRRRKAVQAPGGTWIDACTVSRDGLTYSGANQKNVKITGIYVPE